MGISRHYQRGFSVERRGQVDAPVELFIAVIILAMSMGLAFTVYQNVQTGQCIAELHSQTQQLQNALQQVSIGSSGTSRSVPLTLTQCPGEKVVGVRFTRYEDPLFCKQCLSRYGGCWKIEPLTLSGGRLVAMADATSCVEMSGTVQLSDGSAHSSTCSQLSNNPCPPPGSPGFSDSCGYPHSLEADLGCTGAAGEAASLCRTLGDASRTYNVRLSKGITTGSGGSGEVPVINICAEIPGA